MFRLTYRPEESFDIKPSIGLIGRNLAAKSVDNYQRGSSLVRHARKPSALPVSQVDRYRINKQEVPWMYR